MTPGSAGIKPRGGIHAPNPRDGDAAVVVASEREDNPGASITNTYEYLGFR
jgi:hypothetical protein